MSHIKQVKWGSIFLLIVHVTRWTMELCSVIHFLWLKPWRAIFIKFFFLCFKLVLFFPHLCICQNSEWLKICWLGFSTPKRQLAARFLMFFSEDEEQKSWENDFIFGDFSCCIFSPMHPWKIGRLLIMLFFPSFHASRYKVYEFNNCSWSFAVLLAQSRFEPPPHTFSTLEHEESR